MGSTGKTKALKLSQFIGSDKPSWLIDYNDDMEKIDNLGNDIQAWQSSVGEIISKCPTSKDVAPGEVIASIELPSGFWIVCAHANQYKLLIKNRNGENRMYGTDLSVPVSVQGWDTISMINATGETIKVYDYFENYHLYAIRLK